jgi:hypothetical protein
MGESRGNDYQKNAEPARHGPTGGRADDREAAKNSHVLGEFYKKCSDHRRGHR